jgi:hypothetical protein
MPSGRRTEAPTPSTTSGGPDPHVAHADTSPSPRDRWSARRLGPRPVRHRSGARVAVPEDVGGGPQDRAVAGAPAQVAGEGLAHVVGGRVRSGLPQVRERDDQPRRAVPALGGTVRDERRLHRVRGRRVAEPLDGGDLRALRVGGQHEAGTDQLAVEHHGARPALALQAGVLRPPQTEALAQHPQQALEPGDLGGPRFAVDGEGDDHAGRHLSSVRRASTPAAWRR